MKFTLGEIRSMAPGLNEILGKELPATPSYWLARYMDKVSSEMRAIEKARMNLVRKFAKKDKKGALLFKKDEKGNDTNQVDFAQGNFEKFQKEFGTFLEGKVEIKFKPIKLKDLDMEVCPRCGKKKLVIKPFILLQLGKIIVE